MQTANLLQFGSGGGGFYGQDRDVILKNPRFEEHSFTKLGPDKQTVVETYEPGCMFAVDVYLEDKADDEQEFRTEYYNVGSLPVSRLQELGWTDIKADRMKSPSTMGGYLPSQDGENGAESGPFVVLDGKQDIWENSPFAVFMAEFANLGLKEHADRMMAQGVACLDGVRVHLDTKALPKSKSQLKKEQLSGEAKETRSILVPTAVNSWPWDQPAAAAAPATTVKKTTAGKKAPTAPAPAPVAASTAAPAAAAAPEGDDIDGKVFDYVGQVLSKAPNGKLKRAELASKLFPLTAKDGALRTKIVQRANTEDAIASGAAMGLWNYDPSTSEISLVQ